MCARLREGLRARGVLCGKAQRGDADRHVRARRKAYASNINTKKVDRNAHNMGQVRRRRRLRRTQRSLVLYPHLVRLRTVFTVMQCGGEHKELAGFVRLTTSALLSAVSSEHGAILALRAHVRCDVHQVELNECAAMRSKQAEPSKCAADVQQVEPSECAADVQQASRTSDVQQVEPNEGAVMQKKAESITCPNECVDVHQVESNECAVMRSKQGESNECAASRASALRRAERVRR